MPECNRRVSGLPSRSDFGPDQLRLGDGCVAKQVLGGSSARKAGPGEIIGESVCGG